MEYSETASHYVITVSPETFSELDLGQNSSQKDCSQNKKFKLSIASEKEGAGKQKTVSVLNMAFQAPPEEEKKEEATEEIHVKEEPTTTHVPVHVICDVCGRVLSSEMHLRVHKRIHTGEKPYDEMTKVRKEKGYQCDLCPLRFTSSVHCGAHKRVHTGEYKYMCDVCGLGFPDGEKLLKHRRIHTEEKPYDCKVCGKAFRHNRSLYRHQHGQSGAKPCHVKNQLQQQQPVLQIQTEEISDINAAFQ